MSRPLYALGVLLAVAVGAAEALKSGPAPGTALKTFDVLDVTGPNKDKSVCYI